VVEKNGVVFIKFPREQFGSETEVGDSNEEGESPVEPQPGHCFAISRSGREDLPGNILRKNFPC